MNACAVCGQTNMATDSAQLGIAAAHQLHEGQHLLLETPYKSIIPRVCIIHESHMCPGPFYLMPGFVDLFLVVIPLQNIKPTFHEPCFRYLKFVQDLQ